MTHYTYTTQSQIRAAFWRDHPVAYMVARARGTLSKRQNRQTTTTRCAFVDYVDMLQKSGAISEALAARVTL
jgi:hypothetical protein